MAKNIYVTATRQNEGKTALTLGLTAAFCKKVKNLGFIKPLGQSTAEPGKARIDEDTLLIEKACKVHCNIQDMSPVSVSPGFPQEYASKTVRDSLIEKVKRAYERVAEGKEIVVIEGTGHAAVGGSYGLSNAFVARLFDAKVLLVSSGGVGHPIDEILLNRCFFEKEGVQILGVVINKVMNHEYEMVNNVTRKILQNNGIKLLGVVPFEENLHYPTLMQVLEEFRGTIVSGDRAMTGRTGKVVLGTTLPHAMLAQFGENILLVTSGDREDLLLAAVAFAMSETKPKVSLTGIILTDNFHPKREVLDIVSKCQVPVVVVPQKANEVIRRLENLNVKISPRDREKITLVTEAIARYVDTDGILNALLS
ncbi:MAG: AAA family ATPase [Planctomycetota bacterium]|nr:AAA family ATPase [Planctomycetota bacterium]